MANQFYDPIEYYERCMMAEEEGKRIKQVERSRLIDFLYILARDHLPVGALESIMYDNVDTEPSSYCNTYLEEYTRDLADRLLNLERPITSWKHMHKSADGKDKWCGEQNRSSNG